MKAEHSKATVKNKSNSIQQIFKKTVKGLYEIILVTIMFIVLVSLSLLFVVRDCIINTSVAKKECFTVALLSLIHLYYLLCICIQNY
jgi:hypothetical protein